jgi:DNA-binding HxlR family transcriptional regulator
MLGRAYEDQVCSVARALEVLGKRWTLLIVREGRDDRRGGNQLGVSARGPARRLRRRRERARPAGWTAVSGQLDRSF